MLPNGMDWRMPDFPRYKTCFQAVLSRASGNAANISTISKQILSA